MLNMLVKDGRIMRRYRRNNKKMIMVIAIAVIAVVAVILSITVGGGIHSKTGQAAIEVAKELKSELGNPDDFTIHEISAVKVDVSEFGIDPRSMDGYMVKIIYSVGSELTDVGYGAMKVEDGKTDVVVIYDDNNPLSGIELWENDWNENYSQIAQNIDVKQVMKEL